MIALLQCSYQRFQQWRLHKQRKHHDTVGDGLHTPPALHVDRQSQGQGNDAALSAMRRAPQLGQKPRRLQLKATRCSA